MRLRISRRGLTLTLGKRAVGGMLVLAVALAGGIAFAAIPDSPGGPIHGCYDKSGGLRVIDPSTGASCKKYETSLDWNQAGVPGGNGTNGVSGYESNLDVARMLPLTVPDQDAIVFCSHGKSVLGGGFEAVRMDSTGVFFEGEVPVQVLFSEPTNGNDGWFVDLKFDPATIGSGHTAAIRIWAICADVGG